MSHKCDFIQSSKLSLQETLTLIYTKGKEKSVAMCLKGRRF